MDEQRQPYDLAYVWAMRPPTPGGYTTGPRRSSGQSGGPGNTPRLFLLALLILGLAIWQGPQLEPLLREAKEHAAASEFSGTTTVLRSKATATAITSTPSPDPTTSAPSPNPTARATHLYWQIGLDGAGAPDGVSGMRTTIETVVPQRVGNNTTSYYWLGAYLRDESFIQVGYYVPWYDSVHAGWFYCSFKADGSEGPCDYGPAGSAGANDTLHTYSLRAQNRAGGPPVWQALVDGQVVGTFSWSAGDTGSNTPVLYAESSGFTEHAPESTLGPVDFRGGLEVLSGGTYVRVTDLRVVYSDTNICPPYGIQRDGHGGALIGSGLACPPSGSEL